MSNNYSSLATSSLVKNITKAIENNPDSLPIIQVDRAVEEDLLVTINGGSTSIENLFSEENVLKIISSGGTVDSGEETNERLKFKTQWKTLTNDAGSKITQETRINLGDSVNEDNQKELVFDHFFINSDIKLRKRYYSTFTEVEVFGIPGDLSEVFSQQLELTDEGLARYYDQILICPIDPKTSEVGGIGEELILTISHPLLTGEDWTLEVEQGLMSPKRLVSSSFSKEKVALKKSIAKS